MIRSKYFWIGAILLAVIPLLVMDIPKHYIDWERDVHDEMINVAQNVYSYTKSQKAAALDQILKSNKSLMAMMYIKSFTGIILLSASIYFFILSRRSGKIAFWKASAITILLLAASVSLKIYLWTDFNGDHRISLIDFSPTDTTLTKICNNNFKGKIVYVDFWGTTCIPCLDEFRNFTKPLKEKYHNRGDIAYLYICAGQRLIWKQQLQKFDIQGAHIFLENKDYVKLYQASVKGSNDTSVTMPRYLILNKQGKIMETNALRPSSKDSLYCQLDKYLVSN